MQEMSGSERVPPIIAKLERPEAITNLDAIIDATDGVMVARGDLGVEMSPLKYLGAKSNHQSC